jgi:hypothetical protein
MVLPVPHMPNLNPASELFRRPFIPLSLMVFLYEVRTITQACTDSMPTMIQTSCTREDKW